MPRLRILHLLHTRIFTTLSAVLLALALPAQAAFITDRFEVPVYAEKYSQGVVVKKLVSGSRVDILMKDGKYARVRSDDGSSGWVEYRYITTEKPLGLEYLELRSQYTAMRQELVATQAKLSAALSAPAAPPTSGVAIDEKELAELRRGAKDTRWMRAEMNKARERAKALDAELKKIRQKATDKREATVTEQAELTALQAQNQDLQDRLAAALLVGAASVAVIDSADSADSEMQVDEPRSEVVAVVVENQVGLSIEWFLGSLLAALILGVGVGISWLDRRIRAKHGGFRIY